MVNKIYELLEIPDECKLQERVTKKAIREEMNLSTDKSKSLDKHIEKITLISQIKMDNLNIPEYFGKQLSIEEVNVIFINLKMKKNEDKTLEFVHNLFVEAPLIILNFKDDILISTSKKRFSEINNKRLVVEEIYRTNWINLRVISREERKFLRDIRIRNNSFSSLMSFYEDISEKILKSNLIEVLNKYPVRVKNTEVVRKGIKKVNELKNEIEKIEKEIEKEANAKVKKYPLILELEEIKKRKERDLISYESLIYNLVD